MEGTVTNWPLNADQQRPQAFNHGLQLKSGCGAPHGGVAQVFLRLTLPLHTPARRVPDLPALDSKQWV